MNRLLILIFSFLLANTALADYQISGDQVFTASTQDAVCQQYTNYIKSSVTRITTYSISGGYCRPVDKDGNGGFNKVIIQIATSTCEQKYDSGKVAGTSVSSFCDGQCQWSVTDSVCGADYNSDGSFTGQNYCAYSAMTTGATCSTKTGTPQNQTTTPPAPPGGCTAPKVLELLTEFPLA